MNYKKIWDWTQRIVYLILLIYAFDNGFGFWFILGTSAWFGIWYHKQLYYTMKKWSDMILLVYDGYIMQQQLKEFMKNESNRKTNANTFGTEHSNMESSSSSTRE